jgi:hypothetical protein
LTGGILRIAAVHVCGDAGRRFESGALEDPAAGCHAILWLA